MKRVSLISAGVLLLFLGVVAPAYARQDQQDSRASNHEQQAKPQEQKQAKPEAHQQKPQQQAKPASQEQRQQPKAQPEQAKSNSNQQQQPARPATREKQQQTKSGQEHAQATDQQQQRQADSQHSQARQNSQQKQQQAKNEQEQSSRQKQQSAYSRPPQRTEEAQTRQRAEPSLRLSAMGSGRIPDARFHSNFGRTHEFRIGEPRMVGGYSRFQYGGYWFGFVQPWPVDWYYTDNVYVDYIGGGYYLCNPYYPGVHIAVSVVF